MNLTKRLKPALRALAIAGGALGMVLNSGCVLFGVAAAGAVGAGAVAYVKGELSAALGNPYEAVVGAAGKALADLNWTRIGETRNEAGDEIAARTPSDKKVTVVITRQPDNVTRVRIRVGVLGDEDVSRLYLDRLKADL